MNKQISLDGALRSCKATINAIPAEIEFGQRLERCGFSKLIEGSKLSLDALEQRILEKDWYLTSDETVGNGLISGVV